MTQRKLASIGGGDLPNTRRSILSHIQDGLRKNPHAPAVICMHQEMGYASGLVDLDTQSPSILPSPGLSADSSYEHLSTSCLTLTYLQLHQTALRLCSGLRARGVRPGATLMCLIPNTIEYPILVWASALLRLTLASVDLAVIEDEARLSVYLHLVKPDVLVLHGGRGTRVADTAIASQPTLWECLRVQIHDVTESTVPGWTSFRGLVERGALYTLALLKLEDEAKAEGLPKEEHKKIEEADRICSILFTSGTTGGEPEACPLRVGSMTHILESQDWLINSDNCSRVLQQAHNARAIAYYHTLQTWRAGGTLVMTTGPSFHVEHTVDAILNHAASFIVLSPPMVHALASSPSSVRLCDSSVRDIQVGGDAVTREILVKCAGLFPRARVLINHGMSEGGGFFAWPFLNTPVSEIPYFAGICPVGTVAPGTRLQIRDAVSGNVCLCGQSGEMHISSDSLIRGYLGTSKKNKAFYRDEGDKQHWMNTGDVGMMTQDGLVYILGRTKDAIIKRDGTVIMPAVLESCIDRFTGVQSCVVAVPSLITGDEPFAVLGELQGHCESKIREQVVKILGASYALGGIATLQQLGLAAYPVSATYKVLKGEVQKCVLGVGREGIGSSFSISDLGS
ncbi:acetyl-CoA synthetase-like protein [Xylariaceae sp. FL1019]|nr:acetyl-CoA synthetase-like protein [Xylariaceae sp. FL1019]